MKPLEARAMMERTVALLAAGHGLPPSERSWLVGALLIRLRTPGSNLDQLLGLRSRKGGRLHAASMLPHRDTALLQLADAMPGNQRDRAAELLRRLKAGDPELLKIEQDTGRIPSSRRQLERIIGRKTATTETLERR